LTRRPGTIWLVTVAVMAPFALGAGLLYNRLSYDLVGNLPDSSPSVAGTRVLEAHFPPGMLGPVTVLVLNPQVRGQPSSAKRRATAPLRACRSWSFRYKRRTSLCWLKRCTMWISLDSSDSNCINPPFASAPSPDRLALAL
jgi:hypothetical protein